MLTYEIFMKHADKVCKRTSETRPVLSGVLHQENGHLICTDSHRLYVASGIHNRTDRAVITPAGKKVDGNYPDVSRIIPDPLYAEQTLQLDSGDLLKAADMIAGVGGVVEKAVVEGTKDAPKHPKADFIEDRITYLDFQCRIVYSIYPLRFEKAVCLDATYLLDAMKLFKAAGCQTVTYNFFGSMRPITFTNEDESLLVLILPIRKY